MNKIFKNLLLLILVLPALIAALVWEATDAFLKWWEDLAK